jgi:hypothetical protein
MAELDPQGCADRLSAWQRADRYTSGGTLHVPALAEGKPVRQDSDRRRAPLDTRAERANPDRTNPENGLITPSLGNGRAR